MPYKPKPVDTSRVRLTDNLVELTELLAENTHEVWAQQRLDDGWTLGPERSDEKKHHPCLIPYDDLPESEKEYDRHTALETLKVIAALGFRIERTGDAGAMPLPGSEAAAQGASAIEEALQKGSGMGLSSLLALWRMQRASGQILPLEAHQKLGEWILRRGAPLVAYEVFAEGLTRWPGNVRLRQLMGLALARSGATQRASEVLQAIADEGHADEETLGLLARTCKDLAEQASTSEERGRQIRRACDGYEQAYRLSGGYWTGINAATMATLLGESERGQVWAREVREKCVVELERTLAADDDPYWLYATLGEAALVLEAYDEAEQWYGQAAEVGSGRYGDLSSTRRNARLLLGHLRGDTTSIDRLLPVPRIAVLAGRLSDPATGEHRALTPEAQQALRRQIQERLRETGAMIGYASTGSEIDIVFSEAVLDVEGEAHIVLPYDKDEFVEDTLASLTDDGWRDRFEGVLERAAEVVTASHGKLEGGRVALEYADLILFGLSSLRAAQLETELVPVTVCDASLASLGPAARTIQRWRDRGYRVQVIDLPSVGAPGAAPAVEPPRAAAADFAGEIMVILFADTVSFSRLTDVAVRRFVQHFLGAIAELIGRSPAAPLTMNTWGDGLFAIFDSVRSAGCFALELTDLVSRTDWASKELPEDLNLRVALHAGPVWSYTNPVTGKPDYIGTHVTRAARLEPSTPPGHVYATYGFASIAAAEGVEEFSCEYVGETPLAKSAGMCPTYHLRRRTPRG
jgi:class 3 adenylate cyclase/tetratricopeptide (TPR) repeat protein